MSYSKEVSAMLQYMKDSGVPFTPPTPGMINEGVHTAGSYHYRLGTGGRGLAVDFNGPDERAIFNALGRVAPQLAELIYVAPGITQNVKNGKWVPIYDHAANARNHVHVAVNVGTFLSWHGTQPPAPVTPPPPPFQLEGTLGGKKVTVTNYRIPTDATGIGWGPTAIPYNKAIGVDGNCSSTMAVEIPSVGWQNRDGYVWVRVKGVPNSAIDVRVTSTD